MPLITVCMQCMLEEMVRARSLDQPVESAYVFQESPGDHRCRLHSDLATTERRRAELLSILDDLAMRA